MRAAPSNETLGYREAIPYARRSSTMSPATRCVRRIAFYRTPLRFSKDRCCPASSYCPSSARARYCLSGTDRDRRACRAASIDGAVVSARPTAASASCVAHAAPAIGAVRSRPCSFMWLSCQCSYPRFSCASLGSSFTHSPCSGHDEEHVGRTLIRHPARGQGYAAVAALRKNAPCGE